MMLGSQKIFLTFPYTKQKKPEYLLYIPAFLIFFISAILTPEPGQYTARSADRLDILTIDLFGVSGQNDLIQFSSLTLNTFFDFFHFAAYFVHFTHRTSLNLSVLLHGFFCRASFSLNQYYCDGDNGYHCGKHLRYRKFDPRKQKLIRTESLNPESSDSVACKIK